MSAGTDPRQAGAAFGARLFQELGGVAGAASLAAELDGAGQCPEWILRVLDTLGLADYYIPPEFSGRPTDLEELLQVWRTLARLDLRLVVAHGTAFPGAETVWIAGNRVQGAELAAALRSGARARLLRIPIEPGRDPRPPHSPAAQEPECCGYPLSRTGWSVGDTAGGELLIALDRTGANGHSLLMTHWAGLEPVGPRTEASVPGRDGADVPPLGPDGTTRPRSTLVGAEGDGLSTVLLSLQLTWTLCPALSLGASEYALRLAGRLAAEPSPDGAALIERSAVRAVVARSAGLLAAAEAAAVLTARSAHSLTEELSVLSAAAKGLASTVADAVLTDLAVVLGARDRSATARPPGRPVRTLERQHQALDRLRDTPTVRRALINQFPQLVAGFLRGQVDRPGLRLAAASGADAGTLDRTRLALSSRRGCSAVQALPALTARLAAPGADHGAAPGALLLTSAEELTWLADELHARCAEVAAAPRPANDAYDLAASYELLYGGAAVMHLWQAGAADHGHEPLWRDALWAQVALRELITRLRDRLGLPAPVRDDLYHLAADAFATHLTDAVASGGPLTPFGVGTEAPGPGSWRE